MWSEAKAACETLFGLGYSLCSTYDWLFRGDNGQNPEALKELIFTVDYDQNRVQSYGGTSFLGFSAIAAEDDFNKLLGLNNGWGGNRVPFEYVKTYFNVTGQNYTTGEYNITDKRGQLFYIKGRKENI